jgi:hypothetical protein
MKSVFLLWHSRKLPDEKEDAKLVGVYESREAAERAKEKASMLPGFSEHQDGFEISAYEVGKSYWKEGFVTVIRGQK